MLLGLNYEYIELVSVPGARLFFKKTPHTHHVHFVEYGSEHWEKPLIFRDYLRANPEDRLLYEELKKELAQKFRNNRAEYGKGKTLFVENIIRKAQMNISN